MKSRKPPLIDLCIPPGLRIDTIRRTRARVMVGTLLAAIAVCLLLQIPVLLLHTLQPGAVSRGHLLLLMPTVVFLICLWLFRRTGSFVVVGNLVCYASHGLFLLFVYFTGGQSPAPVGILLVILPILAFILVGIISGLAWALMAFLTDFVLLYLRAQGIIWEPVVLLNQPVVVYLSHLTTYLVIVLSLGVYQYLNHALRHNLESQRNQFAHLAEHDALTGLPNRVQFSTFLGRTVMEAERSGEAFALMYLDLNGFKEINDRLGHLAGDELLQIVADRLCRSVRSVDVVARLSGDEFVVIVRRLRQEASDTVRERDVILIANKLAERIEEPVRIGGSMEQISASFGIVIYPVHARTAENLLHLADTAMYHAKRHGLRYHLHGSNGEMLEKVVS